MMDRALFSVVVIVVALASGGPAAGATPASEREARRAFQNAEAHFGAGRFGEALAEYQAGYDAAPLPGFLINIAQCQRRLGDLSRARATYQKFVVVAPDSPHVPEVKALIAELDKLLADLDREAAKRPSAVSGERPDESPAAVPPVPAAIPPAVSDPAPALGPSPAPEPRRETRRRWWLWGLAGAVVAGAGATVAVFALSSPATTTLHDGSLGTLRR